MSVKGDNIHYSMPRKVIYGQREHTTPMTQEATRTFGVPVSYRNHKTTFVETTWNGTMLLREG